MIATSFVIAPPSGASHRQSEIPIQRFLAGASTCVGLDKLPGFDHQALIGMIRRNLQLPDDSPWDAAFVQHVGYCSHFDYRLGASTWALPRAANGDDLWRVANELDLIRSEPEPADIFTAWSHTRREFVRTGIVVSVEGRCVRPDGQSYYECVTLEGDLNERADGRGGLVRCVRRSLSADSGHCFIRWADIDASNGRIQRAA